MCGSPPEEAIRAVTEGNERASIRDSSPSLSTHVSSSVSKFSATPPPIDFLGAHPPGSFAKVVADNIRAEELGPLQRVIRVEFE